MSVIPLWQQSHAEEEHHSLFLKSGEKDDNGGSCINKASRLGSIEPKNWGSSRSNTGNTWRLHNLLQNLKDTAVKVLVLGGSMTDGHEVGGKEHAWPAFLVHQNVTEFSSGLLKITNRAKGSTGSVWFYQNLGTLLDPYDWDIVMIEAAMNDDNVCTGCIYGSESEVIENFERLVRGIRLSLPQAVIVIVEAFRQNKPPRNGFTSGQIQHESISKYYELPVISIRDAIWHDYDEDIRKKSVTPLTRAFPQGPDERGHWSGHHPTLEGQLLITNIVANELCRFQKEPPSLSSKRELMPPLFLKEEVKITQKWLHVYNFESLDYKGYSDVDLQTKGWDYVVQKSKSGALKPGLMVNNTQPNYATFNVTGCKSTFYVSYMKSYSTFGTASLVFNKAGTTQKVEKRLLRSRWDKSKGSGRYPEVTRFDGDAQFSTLTVSLLPDEDDDKRAFKILEVQCV